MRLRRRRIRAWRTGASTAGGGNGDASSGARDGGSDATPGTDGSLGPTPDAGSDAASSPDAQAGLPVVQVSTRSDCSKGFSAGGAPFVPVGVNDVSKVSVALPADGGIYDALDRFDTSHFDLGAVDSILAAVAANGFNYVRLWLKSADTQQGFAAIPGGLSQSARWQAYVSDVVATIHDAASHGLRVVLTGSFPGSDNDTFLPLSYYAPIAASLLPTSQVDALNRLLLVPAMATQLGQFYSDFLSAMVADDPQIRAGSR